MLNSPNHYCDCHIVVASYCTQYLLVIDCGLSASKFSLFEYTDWYARSNAWIRQRSYFKISKPHFSALSQANQTAFHFHFAILLLGPGISSFVDNRTAGAEAILRAANSVITSGVPPNCQKGTRVFLGAVAGVRMLE